MSYTVASHQGVIEMCFFPTFSKVWLWTSQILTPVTLDVSISGVNRRALWAGHCVTEFLFKHRRVKYKYNISHSNIIILIELIVIRNTIVFIINIIIILIEKIPVYL